MVQITALNLTSPYVRWFCRRQVQKVYPHAEVRTNPAAGVYIASGSYNGWLHLSGLHPKAKTAWVDAYAQLPVFLPSPAVLDIFTGDREFDAETRRHLVKVINTELDVLERLSKRPIPAAMREVLHEAVIMELDALKSIAGYNLAT